MRRSRRWLVFAGSGDEIGTERTRAFTSGDPDRGIAWLGTRASAQVRWTLALAVRRLAALGINESMRPGLPQLTSAVAQK